MPYQFESQQTQGDQILGHDYWVPLLVVSLNSAETQTYLSASNWDLYLKYLSGLVQISDTFTDRSKILRQIN